MKATGIVRRIDDLGRVVIPKEIRRTMRIREGDPLEIYTDREGAYIRHVTFPLPFAIRIASSRARVSPKKNFWNAKIQQNWNASSRAEVFTFARALPIESFR